MSYIYNTLSWAHRVPYKVETVEIVKSPERMKKKQQKKSPWKIPSPQKTAEKIMKNNHKKSEELHFLKNAKRNMRKNKQITAKKEKWKPQSKKTTTRIVHPKKNKPPTIWQKKQHNNYVWAFFRVTSSFVTRNILLLHHIPSESKKQQQEKKKNFWKWNSWKPDRDW